MEVAGRPSEDHQVSISTCDPCMFTGESVMSVSFCVDCIEYLCMNCLEHHKKTKITRDHKTLEGNVVPVTKETFERLQSITLCPVHADQNIIYRCADHSIYACLKCVRSDHLACKNLVDITTLKETGNADIIQSHILKIKTKHNEVHKIIENAILKLNMEKDKVLKKRKQLIDILRDFIVQLEQSSENIKESVKTECENIHAETRPTLKKLEAFTTDANYLKTVADFGNPTQVYIAAQDLRAYNTDSLQLNENYLQLNEEDYSYHIDDTLNDKVYNLLKKLPEPKLLLRGKKDNQELPKKLLKYADAAQTGMQIETDKRNVQGETACTSEHVQSDPKSQIETGRNISSPAEQRILPIVSKEHIFDTNQETSINKTLTIVTLDGPVAPSEKLKVAADSQGFTFVIMCHSKILVILNKKFSVWKQVSLDATPTSIYSVVNGEFLVVFANKKVKRYSANQSRVAGVNAYEFRYHCRSISRYGDDQVVCLCFKPQVPIVHDSHVRNLCVEVRHYLSGKIRNTFWYNQSKSTLATALSVYSRQIGEIIVCSDRSIDFLSDVGERIRLIEWPSTVSGITGDRDGNLYISDKSIYSVLNTSKNTYKVLGKVTELEGLSTAGITYNVEELNLIIVCCKTGSQ